MTDYSKFTQHTPGMPRGRARALPVQDTPQLGTVLAVTAAGVEVEIDGLRTQSCGPAPWSLGTHDTTAAAITAGDCPRTGDRCLVVFAGTGIAAPVVVAWWR